MASQAKARMFKPRLALAQYANKNNLTLLAWYDIYNNLIL